MDDWWNTLLPVQPHSKPPGSDEMLRLIAYDITSPKRLQRVASVCLDYGVRVQYSLFECWLDDPAFHELWTKLSTIISSKEDRLVAYTLDAAATRKRLAAGDTMYITEQSSHWLF